MKIINIEIPTQVANLSSILFNIPIEVMAKIIIDTETVEERNDAIIMNCFMMFILKTYKIKTFDYFKAIIADDPIRYIEEFLIESSKRADKYYG